jgi:hypothetical protein
MPKPVDIRKEGAAFDLPIALGMLAVTDQVDGARLGRAVVLGELGLEGAVRAARGALPVARRGAGGSLNRMVVIAATRRPDHDDVVAARRRDLQRPLGVRLPFHLGEVHVVISPLGDLGGHGFEIGDPTIMSRRA